jgi:hypothetical protein
MFSLIELKGINIDLLGLIVQVGTTNKDDDGACRGICVKVDPTGGLLGSLLGGLGPR